LPILGSIPGLAFLNPEIPQLDNGPGITIPIYRGTEWIVSAGNSGLKCTNDEISSFLR